MAEPETTVWHLSNEIRNVWRIIDEDPRILFDDLEELGEIAGSLCSAVTKLVAARG